MSETEAKPKHVKTQAEFDAAVAAAPGAVVVDFVQQGCSACSPEAMDKLAAKCKDTTVLTVDCDELSDLADKFNVTGTPTTLFAAKGTDFKPDSVEEVDPSDTKFLRRIKCAR